MFHFVTAVHSVAIFISYGIAIQNPHQNWLLTEWPGLCSFLYALALRHCYPFYLNRYAARMTVRFSLRSTTWRTLSAAAGACRKSKTGFIRKPSRVNTKAGKIWDNAGVRFLRKTP